MGAEANRQPPGWCRGRVMTANYGRAQVGGSAVNARQHWRWQPTTSWRLGWRAPTANQPTGPIWPVGCWWWCWCLQAWRNSPTTARAAEVVHSPGKPGTAAPTLATRLPRAARNHRKACPPTHKPRVVQTTRAHARGAAAVRATAVQPSQSGCIHADSPPASAALPTRCPTHRRIVEHSTNLGGPPCKAL